jgi:GAF domain-containing protein
VEPIKETRQVLDDLARYGDERTARQLEELGELVRAIVPECIGISVCLLETGITFTLSASSEEIAALDAVQYIDGGPCVAAVANDDVVIAPSGEELLDESAWQMHAQATAAAGVRSTLSIPIKQDGSVVGGINLYAATSDAFAEHVETLTHAVGASVQEAISNADLAFRSRERARLGPTHLDEFDQVNRAVGALGAARGLDAETARLLLHDSAVRTGLSESQVARVLLAFLTP